MNKQTGEIVSVFLGRIEVLKYGFGRKPCDGATRVYTAFLTAYVLQVAIKKMKKKYYSWEECINLREVKVKIFIL